MKLKIFLITISITAIACSQSQISGYDFALFKNTNNWKLAKAVETDDSALITDVLKDTAVNIDLQEPTFGQTLLHLAIVNDKLTATRVLLENHADVNIQDSEKQAPMHTATHFPKLRKNSYQLIELLLKYGADPNKPQVKIVKGDTSYFYVPLMGAVSDLNCTKLLLDHGADLYTKDGGEYIVWSFLLLTNLDDNVYVAKYLIIDKEMLIPNPISYSMPNKKPLSIYHFLTKTRFNDAVEKEKVNNAIIDYLNKIHFPQNQVYISKRK